eukprot:COSAG05_NODE_972_length_6361_cov_24.297189_3_plen_60_part_00
MQVKYSELKMQQEQQELINGIAVHDKRSIVLELSAAIIIVSNISLRWVKKGGFGPLGSK